MGVQLFCIWLSLFTSFFSSQKPYVYINIYSSLAKPLNTINFFNVVCTCSSALASKPKKKTSKKNNPMSQPIMDLHCFFCFFFGGFCIVSWMPKQKSNVQIALKKLIGFLAVFPTSAQHFQNLMEQNKPMEVYEWLTHVYWALLSHTSWISSRCACFVDFLMVWAPSQKVTRNHGRKYNTAKTWTYNQQTSFSMAFDICFQTLQHMPCAARFFTDNMTFLA